MLTAILLQAQTNLQKASVNALRADNEVEQEIEAFEKRKLEDLKVINLLCLHYGDHQDLGTLIY